MGISGDYTEIFESSSDTTDWHPIYSASPVPNGDKLIEVDCKVRGRRKSNHDAAVWRQVFAIRSVGSTDLELVGTEDLTQALTLIQKDLGAATWAARVRVDGRDLHIEVRSNPLSAYEVEWRVDGTITGYNTPPE